MPSIKCTKTIKNKDYYYFPKKGKNKRISLSEVQKLLKKGIKKEECLTAEQRSSYNKNVENVQNLSNAFVEDLKRKSEQFENLMQKINSATEEVEVLNRVCLDKEFKKNIETQIKEERETLKKDLKNNIQLLEKLQYSYENLEKALQKETIKNADLQDLLERSKEEVQNANNLNNDLKDIQKDIQSKYDDLLDKCADKSSFNSLKDTVKELNEKILEEQKLFKDKEEAYLSQTNDLEKMLKKEGVRKSELKEMLKRSKEELQGSVKLNEELKNVQSDIQAKYNELLEKCSDQSLVNDLKDKIKELTDKLSEKESIFMEKEDLYKKQIKDFEDEVKRAIKQGEITSNKYENTLKLFKDSTALISDLKVDIERLKEDNKYLKNENEELLKLNSSEKSSAELLNDLKKELESSNKSNKESIEKIQELNKQLDEKHSLLKSYETQLNTLVDRINDRDVEISKLKDDNQRFILGDEETDYCWKDNKNAEHCLNKIKDKFSSLIGLVCQNGEVVETIKKQGDNIKLESVVPPIPIPPPLIDFANENKGILPIKEKELKKISEDSKVTVSSLPSDDRNELLKAIQGGKKLKSIRDVKKEEKVSDRSDLLKQIQGGRKLKSVKKEAKEESAKHRAISDRSDLDDLRSKLQSRRGFFEDVQEDEEVLDWETQRITPSKHYVYYY